jgi:hypothetical protein
VFHQVYPKWYTSLWYVRPKPCTYVALRLTLSPNRPKRGSTRPTSPRSSIRCAQKGFWAYCTLGTNREPILPGDWHYLQMDKNKIPFDPQQLGGPSSAAKKIFVPVVHSAQTPNGPKWASTWLTSPRSSIGCTQNDFWANGAFIPNRAPMLRWD